MKTKLIRKEARLIEGLRDFEKRNELTLELSLATDHLKIEKWIMAIWLGYNDFFDKLHHHFKILRPTQAARQKYQLLKPYVWAGFFCFLELDRALCFLQTQNHLAQSALLKLKKLQEDIFLFVNDNPVLMLKSPSMFFDALIKKFKVLDSQDTDKHGIVHQLRENTSIVFMTLRQNPAYYYTHRLKTLPSLTGFDSSSLNTCLIRFLSKDNAYFEHCFPDGQDTKDFLITKKILETKMGCIDGLLIKHRSLPKDTVVLALVGSLSHEHLFISRNVKAYWDLFRTDVFLLTIETTAIIQYIKQEP